MPATSEVIRVNASAPASTLTPCIRGTLLAANVTSTSVHHQATSTPSAPPASATRRLSINRRRPISSRLAPSAACRANSRLRAVAWASCRLATLAHAISNTSYHHAAHQLERPPHRSDHLLREGHQVHGPVGIEVGIFRCEAGRDCDHLSLCALDSDAWGEAGGSVEVASAGLAVVDGAVETHRDPDVRLRHPADRLGLGRHDAEHGVGGAIESDGLAYDGRVGVVPRVPEPMTQQRDIRSTRLVVLRSEGAAELGGETQQREETGRHPLDRHLHRLTRAAEAYAAVGDRGHARENRAAGGPVQVVSGRDDVAIASQGAVGLPDGDHAVWLGERQRTQEDGADHREDRGVGSDSKRETGDRGGGEARGATQAPERKA